MAPNYCLIFECKCLNLKRDAPKINWRCNILVFKSFRICLLVPVVEQLLNWKRLLVWFWFFLKWILAAFSCRCNLTERFTSAKKEMPRKPCTSEFLHYSKRSLIPKRAAFFFFFPVTCSAFSIGTRSAGAPHLCPAISTPAQSRFFGGAFYPFPKLLIAIFFPPSARREGGSALSASLGRLPRDRKSVV